MTQEFNLGNVIGPQGPRGFPGVNGTVGSDVGMVNIPIDLTDWNEVNGKFEIQIDANEHGMGNSSAIIASLKVFANGAGDASEIYDSPLIKANGDIVITSDSKWEGFCSVCGGIVQVVIPDTFDKIIRMQQEFNDLVSSPDWQGAASVAFVGQFVYGSSANGGIQSTTGIKIPITVKQICGFNDAKITVTNFTDNSLTAKAGLWYNTLPATSDYSIEGLTVDCTSASSGYCYGFSNCTQLTNCTGKGAITGTGYSYGFSNCTQLTNCKGTGITPGGYGSGYGFSNCIQLTNCTGIGTTAGVSGGYGFYNCTQLTNCTGTGTGPIYGYGFYNCTQLTNCIGTGTGSIGLGFYSCSWLNGCRGSINNEKGGSTMAFISSCQNVDWETCRPTAITNTPSPMQEDVDNAIAALSSGDIGDIAPFGKLIYWGNDELQIDLINDIEPYKWYSILVRADNLQMGAPSIELSYDNGNSWENLNWAGVFDIVTFYSSGDGNDALVVINRLIENWSENCWDLFGAVPTNMRIISEDPSITYKLWTKEIEL